MSYSWNGAKILTSDQNLRSYCQKPDFHVFGQKTFTKKISNFDMAAAKLQEFFWIFSQYHLKVYHIPHTRTYLVEILASNLLSGLSGAFEDMGADSAPPSGTRTSP